MSQWKLTGSLSIQNFLSRADLELISNALMPFGCLDIDCFCAGQCWRKQGAYQ